MKRLGAIWPQIISFENLYQAYLKARKGKSQSKEVAEFSLHLERKLLRLQWQLEQGIYQPGDYRFFTLYERKPRLIAAAPFVDRVVHHALLNIIEPVIDRQFIYDSYACRKGKGVHAAVDRYQNWAKQYRYALKMDISRYFPSIEHQCLKAKLAHKIKDRPVLDLLYTIIEHTPKACGEPRFKRHCGLPIGNLTSQFFANLYLDAMDHYLKEICSVKAYLRYVDDFIILSNDKSQLHEYQQQIEDFLAGEYLCLHPRKANIFRTDKGVDVFGYRVFPDCRQLRNDNGHRFARKLRAMSVAYNQGRCELADINPSVQSWIGHALHGETWGLRKQIFSSVVFTHQPKNTLQ